MKRKSLLKALGGLSVVCLAGAFAFFPAETVATKAETEETPVAVENVAMAYGAAVRISTDSTQGNYAGKSGLRFTMYIDKDTYDTAVETYGEDKVEVGMYYVGKNIKVGETVDETTDAEMQNIATIPASARHAVMEAYIDASAKTVEPSYAFNVAQLDIPESGYNVQLIANGYIKTIDSEGNEDYTWATNPQTRSVAQVASIGISKGNTHSDLHNFVNAVATEDTFQFENTAFDTDMYKQAELNVNATVPAHLQVVWESDNEEVATVDETGKITKVGKGTANVTAKIGNNVRTASVTIGDPIALKVQSGSEDRLNQSSATYIANGEGSEIADFTGGYTGDAIRVQSVNNGHHLYSDYTETELQEIAKIYNQVKLWIAVDNIASGNAYYMRSNDDNIVGKLNGANIANTVDDNGKWVQYTLPITDYISLLTEEVVEEVATGKSYVKLFHIWNNSVTVEEGKDKVYFYIGNVEFYLSPYVVKVDAQTATNKDIYNTDKGIGTYIANGEDSEIANFGGEYNGNAVRYAANSNNNNVAKVGFTLDQLNTLASKYDNVSMWVAVDNLASGTVVMDKNWTTPTNFFYLATSDNTDCNFKTEECATWYKFTISAEDFISICTTTDETTGVTTVNENFYMFVVYSSGVTASEDRDGNGTVDVKDIYFYVGDIFFE